MPSRIRILSIDGGGIRGVLTAALLDRIEAARSGFLSKVFLFAGTSTGGILALGLAAGRAPSDMRDLYVTNARDIFDDSIWDDLRDLGRLRGAEYGLKKLKRALVREFGDITLRRLRPRHVLIPTFDLDNVDELSARDKADPSKRHWKPKFFHNLAGSDSKDGAELVVDVALRTSAAPTYFPSYQGYVDGGVVANNPAMAALAQALDARGRNGGCKLEEIALLSLGTGTSLEFVKGRRHDWGYAQWVKPLVRLILDGNMGVADYQCRQILRDRYCRLAPIFPAGTVIQSDDIDRIPELLAFAAGVDLDPTLDWLDRNW